MDFTRKDHGDYMGTRGFTTVSLRKETYEAGRRWMAKHGYGSWEGMIRGVTAGHHLAPPEPPDLARILQRLDTMAESIGVLAKPNPSKDREFAARLGNLESMLKGLTKFEELRYKRTVLEEARMRAER